MANRHDMLHVIPLSDWSVSCCCNFFLLRMPRMRKYSSTDICNFIYYFPLSGNVCPQVFADEAP